MDLNDEKKLDKIKEHVKKIEYLRYTNRNLLYWDTITNMPSKGIEFRSEVMAFLAGEIYKLSEDREFVELVNYFGKKDVGELDITTSSMIRKIKKNYEYINRIPKDEYKDYAYLITETEEIWGVCKKDNDFETIVPYLEKVVDHFKNFAEYWGYEENPYDAILSFYESGTTVKKLDSMFEQLKYSILVLLKDIETSKVKIGEDILKGTFNKETQSKMTIDILNKIGFDFEAGRVDEGRYPTILSNYNKDVRIITSYNEDDFMSAFTTALHAGGQALYEQGISSELYGTLLAEPSSMVILEAIARFYENILGKDKNFWEFYFPVLKEYFPQFKSISKENFVNAINSVKPSFIRVDSDEITYNIHIIIRYEIEKDLINNKLEVKDIPNAWNQKFRDYLAIDPPNNSLGLLQDVHWFSGYLGYFPSYIVGNFYAAQIYNKLKIDKPDYENLIASGKWKEIHEWFEKNIFRHGAIYSPEELIYLVTDENLKADYFIEYLEEKYKEIYEI